MENFLLDLHDKSFILQEVVMNAFDEHNLKVDNSTSLLEVLIDIAASLTPIIGVQDKCQAQSKAYMAHLFEPEDELDWPIRSMILIMYIFLIHMIIL